MRTPVTCAWCPHAYPDQLTTPIATTVFLTGCVTCDTIHEEYLCQNHGEIADQHVTLCPQCSYSHLETLWEPL